MAANTPMNQPTDRPAADREAPAPAGAFFASRPRDTREPREEDRRSREPRDQRDRRQGNGPGNRGPGAQPPSRGLFGMVSLLLLILFVFMLMTVKDPGQKIPLAEFEQKWKNREIDNVTIYDNRVTCREKVTGKSFTIPLNTSTHESVVAKVDRITNGNFTSEAQSPWTMILVIFGPFVLLIMLIWFLVSRGLRSAGGAGGVLGNFGKSRHRTLTKEMTNITFADVAGVDEAKEEVSEIIEFLRNPKKFTKLGGRIPRGVLLVGEPGCGKTLLAKAIAGEADVPFFSIAGSDFVEMFVGVGASRVRDLFKQAKESAPCIIFLDEIDAVGRRRGGGYTTGGHDEREQTLNAILVEMDGFSGSEGVIVVAATNRSDVLDPALIRPGRFDRQIVVPLPDVKGRLEILKVHAKKVTLGPDVNLERIARGTPMFSGADLAAIINEAAIGATMHNKDFVEQEDLEEARDKVKFGRSRRSMRVDKDENRATAYHEAGHAVLQAIIPNADPLHKVTIIPRGQSLGATFSLPEKDRTGYGLKWLKATMRVACGGRIAEEKATGDIGSGAAMDIMQVTSIARKMILEWGMSDKLGFVRYEGKDTRDSFLPDKDYSDQTAKLIDEEIKRLVDEAFADARRIIEENWSKVVAIAEALLKYETLSSDDVDRLMKGQELNKPSVSDMLRAEMRRKTAEEAARSVSPPEPEVPPSGLPSPA